ncbi:hypothetical protein IV203_019894 [Nitzschia inconspicua]|uniref:Uncharacterized protein n=1 Tax=Nitzschia inconspicua TaxID=303405 RepID=A0A9K3Q7S3_9STRA|nr:hypothetical protein IV203_019894 [Nitzschia inconspicua]
MNPTYADDFRGPPALNSRVDADSDSGFVRIAPTSSANRRSLPDNRAILTDIPTSEFSAPTDSPAPAPTMCSHGSTLRVSTASTYGDDVHASIGCDVPFALSAIPPTGDGDLRAALEAVSLFASNILAYQTSGDLRAALASVSSFTSTVLAHHLQPSADSSIESGPALSAPHSTSQPPASTATDAPSLVDTAAATAAPVLCFHDPTTLASSSCPSSDYSVSAYQPFELPSEFGQSALAHCPVHTGPLLLCSSAVSSDISCHPTLNLCPSLAFLPWPPFAPPWDYSFGFPLAPAPPWCFSSWFTLWSQREHLLVAPPWPSTAGLVLQREHVPTVAPPWLSPTPSFLLLQATITFAPMTYLLLWSTLLLRLLPLVCLCPFGLPCSFFLLLLHCKLATAGLFPITLQFYHLSLPFFFCFHAICW